jgi:hypothetical protein
MAEAQERCNRQYKASSLPVLRDGAEAPPRSDVLLALYGQACSGWRMLTDVRFKLLALVPTVSVLLLIGLLSGAGENKGLSANARVGIIVLGAVITFALYVYDRRNSELYNDLISRARRIEDELGVDTGLFRGRPKPSNSLIQHDVATNLVYGAALGGWLFALLATWLGWA